MLLHTTLLITYSPQPELSSCEREAGLTGNTVDSFQGSQDTDSTDCRQVNVLEIQGVLHHPARGEREREIKRKVSLKESKISVSATVVVSSLKGFWKLQG